MEYEAPLFNTKVALFPPKNVTVPLKLKLLPDVEVPVIATLAVPERICRLVLSMAMLEEVMVSLLAKVLVLPILEVWLPFRV